MYINFNKRENYLKVIRIIFKKYPHIHQYIIQDLNDWRDGRRCLPYTRELRKIIADIYIKERLKLILFYISIGIVSGLAFYIILRDVWTF